MGIDINDLPKRIQDKVKETAASKPDTNTKARAVPHDSRMNKTEQNYAGHLEKLKMSGKIVDWAHEPFNLRLADRTFYKPDFIVVSNDGYIEIHEVKGRWMDDALVKIKVAAEMHPWFTFKAVFQERGGWRYRRFDT